MTDTLTEALALLNTEGVAKAQHATDDGIGPATHLVMVAARRWASFPTDEDVEVAAKAMAFMRGAPFDGMLSVAQNVARRDARAALEAVKREDR